jgi:DNA-binding NarL/FixJ family response regulator
MQSGKAHVRTLIVDDSPTFLRTVCSFLDHHDAVEVVATADNAPEAFQLVERLGPDLVLMDLQMQGMNGLEATAELRQRFPATRVIMVTGHDTQELRAASQEMGAEGFVCKGRLAQELPAMLAHILASLEDQEEQGDGGPQS